MSSDATERALTMLSLLSSRNAWTGPELAERLGVTVRTVRRDIDRLRALDYEIDSTGGVAGGYRFRAGSTIPPLFFDEDESVAVVAALIVAVGNQTTGMLDGSTRALGKLHHLLPPRLIGTVAAVQQSAIAAPVNHAPQVDPRAVASLAEACRNRMVVRFDYRSRADAATSRRVEPNAIVTVRSVWYLIGFDLDRNDWRVFRLDRMDSVGPTGHGAVERELPAPDPLTYLVRSLAGAPYAHGAQITLGISVADLQQRAPWVNEPRIERTGARSCVVRLGGDSADDLVGEIVRLLGTTPVRAIEVDPTTAQRLERLRDGLALVRRSA